jgi:hypothetical protein
MDGQPFFVVNQAIYPGVIKVIEHEIVPQLKAQVPHQPNAKARQDNPLLHRFVLVFDREGYSPDFMLRMKAQPKTRQICSTHTGGGYWASKCRGLSAGQSRFTRRNRAT